MLSKYLNKYFSKYDEYMYADSLTGDSARHDVIKYRVLQEKMLKFTFWEKSKCNLEYNAFIDFIFKNYKYNEKDLDILFQDIICLFKKILVKDHGDKHDLSKLTLKIFWYKALRNIGKYYYYNPDKFSYRKADDITNMTIKLFYEYIPIEDSSKNDTLSNSIKMDNGLSLKTLNLEDDMSSKDFEGEIFCENIKFY